MVSLGKNTTRPVKYNINFSAPRYNSHLMIEAFFSTMYTQDRCLQIMSSFFPGENARAE